MTSRACALRAHIDRQNAHWLRPGIGAEVRRVHGLHESVALPIGALAAIAVVDRDFAFKHVGRQRHAMLVQNCAAAGRQRDDRRCDMR